MDKQQPIIGPLGGTCEESDMQRCRGREKGSGVRGEEGGVGVRSQSKVCNQGTMLDPEMLPIIHP